MHDIHKFRTIYRLKSIYRFASVDKRHESTAEHTWSALMLADYVMSRKEFRNLHIDRLKVLELLMYHDLVEIHAGDTPLDPKEKFSESSKIRRENVAFKKLVEELPKEMAEKYSELFHEYETRSTIEARFAKAIDRIDGHLHELDYKKDWKGWTETFMREKAEGYFDDFPVLKNIFEEMITYLNENGFFTK